MNDLQDNQGQGVLYVTGTRGYSAYEIAVQNGFVGTEQEWLDSLVGPQGEPGTPFDELTEEQKAEIRGDEGKSAYDIAVENGFIGTEQDWVNSFLTPDGYYNKDEVDEKITDEIEFIFNSQKDLNESYFFKTEDTTPVYDKKYFIKSDDNFYNNGYLSVNHLTEFDETLEYYERDENTNTIPGECFIIKAFGKTIMLDTGGTNRSEPIKKYLQEHNVTKIDYLILSHYHYDHCTNLSNMVDYLDFSDCKCYFPRLAPVLPGSQNQTIINNFIATTGVEVIYPNELDTLNIGELKITFYNCGQQAFNEIQELYGEDEQKINDYSMLALFTYRNTNILYSGDIEYIAQERLYNKGFFNDMKIDLYKYHHHGTNFITNCYIPFLTEMSPKQVVIVSYFTSMSRDRVVLNLNSSDCVFLNDVSYISTGQEVILKKRKQQEFQLKNKNLYSNSFDLNSYYHILTIKVSDYYKNFNMLFVLNDIQKLAYRCLFRIAFRTENSTFDSHEVVIENIASTGSHHIIDDIYVGMKNNTFNLYLKKTFSSNTPTITLLSSEYYPDMYKIEYGYENLTEEEFNDKYDNNYVKGSFENLLTLTDSFETYNSSGTNPLCWCKTGNIVEISGIIKNVVQLPVSPEEIICVLPDEIQPAGGDRLFIQQSNSTKQWCAHIIKDTTLNKYVLKFSRYGGDGTGSVCEIGAFLCVSIMYVTNQ